MKMNHSAESKKKKKKPSHEKFARSEFEKFDFNIGMLQLTI